MTITINSVPVALGASSAPLIEGSASEAYGSQGDGVGFSNSSPFTGRRGCRVALAGTTDFSTHDFAGFGFYTTSYNLPLSLASVANGGIRIVFVDSVGGYAGYNVYGSGIPDYAEGISAVADGFFVSYVNIAAGNERPVSWQVSRSAAPDIAGGVIDWSEIVAIEITTNVTSASPVNLYVGALRKISNLVATGNVTPSTIFNSVKSLGGQLGDMQHWVSSSLIAQSAAVRVISAKMGVIIGDGITPTQFTAESTAIGFFNTYDTSPAFRSVGPLIILPADKSRALFFNQSAEDTLSITDSSVASSAWWQWELSGSGVASCSRVDFWRFNGFKAAHGAYTDCAWNAGAVGVEVTLATTVSGGVIRNASSTALKIIGAAGDYSALQLEINSPSATYDIELGSGGAGAYDLQNISIPSEYTMRVHNNSVTNAIVVKLPLGMLYSTTTAGGAITVEVPAVTVTINAPALINGSRVQLYSVTDSVELLNTVLVSEGLDFSIVYTANKVIRLRADHSTKLPLETLGVLTSSGLTFLDTQADDNVYLGNGIDGGSVSEFSPDGANIQVDINDPDGVTNIQRLYAWLQWYMTTENGVRSTFFGAVSAVDTANYLIDQSKADIKLDNVSVMPVRVVGGYLSRRDGSTVIAPESNSIQMDPGKAYAIETGVSGLTPDEGAKLEQISMLATEATVQAALDATAAVPGAVWGYTL